MFPGSNDSLGSHTCENCCSILQQRISPCLLGKREQVGKIMGASEYQNLKPQEDKFRGRGFSSEAEGLMKWY
jgi:hypothetical protein